jgi:GMP synthase-like glutamine amidotransferase
VPFEGLGSIAEWAMRRGADVQPTRLYAGDGLPALEDVDMVIAMGGPMSVNDDATLPWVAGEKRFIREAIERGLPVLGICLGAQLIASALTARVYPLGEREIGWFPVEHAPVPGNVLDGTGSTPFHWHGETFDLPTGAVRLASNAACANQAFALNDRPVVGLQFHLEATPETVDALVAHCRSEMTPSRYVQTEDELRAAPARHYVTANRLIERVLEILTQRVTAHT